MSTEPVETPILDTKNLFQQVWVTIFLVILSVFFACILGAFAVNWYATSSPNAGITAAFCVGVAISPQVQIGISWDSVISSYLSPLTLSPLAVCIQVPAEWLPDHSWRWLWPR